MSELNQRNKETAIAFWGALDRALKRLRISIVPCGRSALGWLCAFCGYTNCGGLCRDLCHPLYGAFDQVHRETHIVMGGVSDGRADGETDGRHWVGGTGYLHAKQIGDLGVIPARNMPLRLRWGEFLEFDEAGKITRIQTIIDVIDWLEQINLSPFQNPQGLRMFTRTHGM